MEHKSRSVIIPNTLLEDITGLMPSLATIPSLSGFFKFTAGQNFLLFSPTPVMQHAVIVLPPFAEEMNKSRHIFKQLFNKLAEQNQYGFMLDNYGTGDSEGDLDQASITLWRADLELLIQQIANWGFLTISFISLRFGTLQLFDLLNHYKLPLPIKQVVLWQPMFDPARFWQQFCRIKVAEAMANGDKVSQKQIEQQLEQGDIIEIAGYPINLAFYKSVQHINATLPSVLTKAQLSWFELSMLDNIAIPVQNMRENLVSKYSLNFKQIKADAFWQTTELASADELIALTVQQLVGAEQ
ncbi:alpha/beta hydrolase family protein [Rheinheimera salexigens]|nr:glycosyl transferase [Rheinheimera salexigens]